MNDQIRHYCNKLEFETDSWDLAEAIKAGAKIVVVDVRSAEAYAGEHIPGAISLPHRAMTAESTRHLDKSFLYVAYCDGIGCNGSTRGALKLAQLGFQVKELIGGLEWWRRDGYATEGSQARAGTEVKCAC